MSPIRASVFLLFLSCLAFTSLAQQESSYPFEQEIIAFKKMDSRQMPEPGGLLFVGSSSIRMWEDFEERFADLPVIRRGVGGCQLVHVLDYYMDEIVYPYHARKIFVYAGENDIVSGRPPGDVARDFKKLWTLLRKQDPQVEIYYLAIKPSTSRLEWSEQFNRANSSIRKFLRNKKKGGYIDVASVVLKQDGTPDDSLFLQDKLHLNTRGYDKWEAEIRPFLSFD